MNPQDAWNAALNQLEIQLDRGNFNTWLRNAEFLDVEASSDQDAVFVIGVPSTYARDMLTHRLYRNVRRILSDVCGNPVELRFVVHKPEPVPVTEDADMPLFQFMARQDPGTPSIPLHEQVARPQRPDLPESELNSQYTFERFVVGNVNHLVYAAAQAVADNPASVYNPLLIYGGVGLGKTHLLQAIAQRCRSRGYNAVYVPSEAFINDLVNAIRHRTTAMFRDRYRTVDVLLVDDIQFIAGKESTQEEFFHTFNALFTFNKQIVLASDRHPRELETLEARLRSRFEGGLIMDVQPPEYETRVAIVEMWAQERRVTMPRSVTEMIADHAGDNIRELFGLFTQVIARAQLDRQPLTLADAEAVMVRFERPRQHRRVTIDVDCVVRIVADHHGLTTDDLTSKRRAGRINSARQIAMYLARELTDASLPQIGDALGGRSHTTVLHGYNKVVEQAAEDDRFRYELTALREKVLENAG